MNHSKSLHEKYYSISFEVSSKYFYVFLCLFIWGITLVCYYYFWFVKDVMPHILSSTVLPFFREEKFVKAWWHQIFLSHWPTEKANACSHIISKLFGFTSASYPRWIFTLLGLVCLWLRGTIFHGVNEFLLHLYIYKKETGHGQFGWGQPPL